VQTIGLIGGLSWESSAAFYEGLNKGVQERLGGLHSAKVQLASVDLAELTTLQEKEEWGQVGALLAEAAQGLERAGADFVVVCSTTFHKVYDDIAAGVSIPVLHLADLMAEKCKAVGIAKVGFLSTAYTMQDDFFAQRLSDHGIDVNLPDPIHIETLDSFIYDELVFRTINPSSRRRLRGIVDELCDSGVDGVLFAASGLALLLRPGDVETPILDLITVGVEACLDRALA